MTHRNDRDLLADWAAQRSQAAFRELVRRHIDLVHSAARRMVRAEDLAEDVTQSVFLALAQEARDLLDHPVLSAWLHRTALNLGSKVVRSDVRRRAHEKEAAAVNRLSPGKDGPPWEDLAPHLDAALEELDESDRAALLLRFFERQSAREMGATLGISEEAAQKRVHRAVERLREVFVDRRIQIGAAALATLLAANAVQAAPEALPETVATAASGAAAEATAAAQAPRLRPRWIRTGVAAAAVLGLIGLAGALVWAPQAANPVNSPAGPGGRPSMKIQLSSVMVDDQAKAFRFYTGVVGLVVKHDIPVTGGRWLTLVSPQEPDGMELVLEPLGFPPANTYQKQLFEAGIPWTALPVGDVQREHDRMKALGAVFKVPPTLAGPTTIAVFEDTCGNLIQLFKPPDAEAGRSGVRVRLVSVLVKDQTKALDFYTKVLGFVKKHDVPAGAGRWLTVVSAQAPDGPEIVLEPMGFAPARDFQAALHEAGIPLTAFEVGDVEREHARLKGLGVKFTMAPTRADPTVFAVLDDTCGNLIQLFQN